MPSRVVKLREQPNTQRERAAGNEPPPRPFRKPPTETAMKAILAFPFKQREPLFQCPGVARASYLQNGGC